MSTDPRMGGDPEPETETDEAPADDKYINDDGEFDADAYFAEARAKPYPFRWAGERWELTNVYDLDDSILDLLGREDLSTDDIKLMVEAAFGKEQWAALTAKQRLPIKVEVELFNRWLRKCGVNPGEAENSAASSNGTAGRSKRTYSGTTASASPRRSTARKKTATRRVRSST